MKSIGIMVKARNGAVRCSITNLPGLLSAVALILAACVLSAQPGHSQNIPGEYIVLLKPGNDPAEVANAHSVGARHTYSSALNGFAASIPDGRLRALQNDPRVELVEPDQQILAFAQIVPTGVRRIGAMRSATAKIDGIDERVNVDVAILDSGIDLSHPDLNVFSHVTFVNDGSGGNDGYGHGTYMAGIVGALDNDFGVVGVAPGARLWAVKVIGDTGAGSLSTLISGVDYVTANAASIEVANISAGFIGTSSALRTAIQNCVARGVVVVAAAGNNAQDVYGADGTFGTADDTIPAAFPEVITVSSMNDSDGVAGSSATYWWEDCFSSYSNFGRKIELAGVGTTTSTALMVKGGYGNQFTGTSLAAAHVSGAAALYIAGHGRATNAAGVTAIKQALLAVAEPQSTWGPANTRDPDTYHEPLLHVVDASSAPANTRPTVAIASPASGANFGSGATIPFSGTATDAEDGALSTNLTWTSSIDGVIGTGGSFSKVLSSGTHSITASVSDSGGLSQSTNVSITVQSAPPPNSAPAVVISSPASGSIFGSGAAVTFSGTANDVQDGNLSSNLVWTSSIDGAIGTGAGCSRVLSSGTHIVTATATDSGALSGSASVSFTVQTAPPPNTAPTVTIASPLSGASFSSGASISFSGSAMDVQDGVLSSNLVWRSSIDGQIGTGGSFNKVLSSGPHTVTASVTDSGGLTGSASVTFTVQNAPPPNTSPTVAITSPLSGASFRSGASVSFSGSATDVQDGVLSSNLVWTSSIDGQIGTGSSFSKVLSRGTHTLTASVTDSGGLANNASVSVTVQVPPPNLSGPARVGDKILFAFNVLSNQTYTVESRDSLSANWSTLRNISAQPANTTFYITNTISSAERYFRVKAP